MNIIILAAGEQGRMTLSIQRNSGKQDVRVVGFIDDDPGLKGKEVMGVPVLGCWKDIDALIQEHHVEGFVVGLGDNCLRKEKFQELTSKGLKPATIIHKTAIIDSSVTIRAGTTVNAGAIINLGTTIGDNCIINTGVILEHDNVVENHCNISPGAVTAGGVRIETLATVGMNSTILDDLIVGRNAFVGAGAVLIRNVEENKVVVGNPAKILRENSVRCQE